MDDLSTFVDVAPRIEFTATPVMIDNVQMDEFTYVVNVEFYIWVVTTLKVPVTLAPVPEVIGLTDEKVLIARRCPHQHDAQADARHPSWTTGATRASPTAAPAPTNYSWEFIDVVF
ncbi:hypothetical protein [Streptomyces sp. NPDC058401]|uniref:hypothetical protein n=1 Tax=Streptomyces sp. NPDC058401 TaxID=3346480 RepID=UPI003661B568